MSKNQDLLFILGAGKTATTSLCGLLNSHPDVFVMCEVLLNHSQISRYGTKLIKAVPELLPCFFRAHGDRSGSSGLGLSIVKAVAESHHGSVRLEPPLDGRGARFVVRFPAKLET